MGSKRPPKGLRVTRDELGRFHIPARVGDRFTSNMLDIFPGVFEVLALDESGAVVALVSYILDAGTPALTPR